MIGEETRKLPVKVDLNTSAGDEIIRKTVYKDTVRFFSLPRAGPEGAEDLDRSQDTGAEIDPKRDIKKFYQVGKDNITTGTTSAKIFFSEADVRKVKVCLAKCSKSTALRSRRSDLCSDSRPSAVRLA